MIYNPGLTRVAVKMLKPHHSGSEHAEADLLSEYNLLKEVRTVNLQFQLSCLFKINECHIFILVLCGGVSVCHLR